MDAKTQVFKTGMIILWSGSLTVVPSGWVICDGNNNTPDLRDRFIVGAGNTYSKGDTGGATTHLHSGSPADHGHAIASGSDIAAGSDYQAATSGSQGGGNVATANGLPPYLSLAYIMKL